MTAGTQCYGAFTAEEFIPAQEATDSLEASFGRVKGIWEETSEISKNEQAPRQKSLHDTRNSNQGKQGLVFYSVYPPSFAGSEHKLQHLVDKIVRNQDQPASLLLQQKLKSGNTEVQSQIIDAILVQTLEVIRNRFGNFLIQRCLEVGQPKQVKMIASAMNGCVVQVSCDRFGCHVVQKVYFAASFFFSITMNTK
jgi:hypothetical protein